MNKPNHAHVESKKVEAKASPTPQLEPESKPQPKVAPHVIKINETLSTSSLIKLNIEAQLKLYLARVYARLKDFEKSKFYYQALIKKKPNVTFSFVQPIFSNIISIYIF